MPVSDIYTDGIAQGWKVIDASTLTTPQTYETDIVIIGSGAGGGLSAEILTAAGFKVLLVEEGPLKTSASFKDMDEKRAYQELYQEGAGRATSDGAIAILQGRSVGGSTTVNWSSSFRTPAPTLAHWASHHEVKGHSAEEMAPWFAKMEERLNVAPWAQAPNENNSVLKRGCDALGWESHIIPRNVKGCWNSGYCGFGCPVNAKQSMLVSTIPEALSKGATLIHHLRINKLALTNSKVTSLVGEALGADASTATGVGVTIKARHYIVAGGAINSPALMLRSEIPDPYKLLGKRTFIHPVAITLAAMPKRVDPYYGAPQSVASDHFQWKDGATGPAGFKLEVPPMFPGISAGVVGSFGAALSQDLASLPYTNAVLALLRDGFVPESVGGQVRVAADGSPILDYEMTPYLWDGVLRAYLTMAEAQFAGGATAVRPAHSDAIFYKSWTEAKQGISTLPLKKFRTALFSAHLMGGCGMSENPQSGVVNSTGRHHQVANLSVMDGSVFPTSIGANPQLSVYGLIAQNVSALAKELAS